MHPSLRARPESGYQVARDACGPHVRRHPKISNPQPAPAGMNLKLFTVGQTTSNQTSHLREQALRPRLRGKELSLEVCRRQWRLGFAYLSGEFGGQPCNRSNFCGYRSSNHAFSTWRHGAFDL
jgi:hypothetical protein